MRNDRVITKLDPGTRTMQEYRDENNPNTIIRRYNSSGQITGRFRDKNAGAFIDCPATLKMFQDARDLYMSIEQTFSDLPVNVRAHFQHSPELLLQAMENPSRRDELEKLGVLTSKPPAEPVGTEPALAVTVPTGTPPKEEKTK